MKIVNFAINRPVSVFIFAVAAVVFGWVAFGQLAVNLLPDITYPSLTVRTEYEGTAPVEIESLLTRPIENAVGVVNNVVRVSSSSRADVSEVVLEFAWGTDMDFASLDVRERLDAINLPIAVERPVLLRFDPSLDPIMRIAVYGGSDLGRLRFLADEDVKRALERLEGVAAVVVSGGFEEEIQVEIDEQKLASLGLDVARVSARLKAENINMTGGALRDGQTEYLVRTMNEYVRADDLRSIVIHQQGNAVIRVRDVARVSMGYKEREIITRINGEESVELAIYKEGGSNTVTVSDLVTERLLTLRGGLVGVHPDLGVEIITDQARYIRQSIQQVLETAFYGGLLAVLVLYFFLRSFTKTLIIAISIPVSVVATFFCMYVAGISLNIMSLGGITLGVGLLVDNAIVVLEAVQRKSDAGLDVLEAAREGSSEVGRAITASTLTTICVFVPIVFVEGVSAQLFRDQALTVACALAVSLLVALTLIPMLVSRRPPTEEAHDKKQGTWLVRGCVAVLLPLKALVIGISQVLGLLFSPLLEVFDRGISLFSALYEVVVIRVVKRPWVALLLTLVLFLLSLGLYSELGRELIPELIQGEVFANVELAPGTRLEVSDRRIDELATAAAELEGIRTVYTIAGASNEQGGAAGELRENIAQLTLTFAPPVSREREDAVINSIRSAVDDQNLRLGGADSGRPMMSALFARPSYFSFKTAVEVEISGPNLKMLDLLAEEALRRMRGLDGLRDVTSSTEGGHPELQVHFDRDRLASYGLTVAGVADVVRSKVQGEVATEITRQDRTIDIRVRNDECDRDSSADLEAMIISLVNGVPLQLSAVADVIEMEGPAEIRRADGTRVAVISANLSGIDLGTASIEIENTLGAMRWPGAYDFELKGQEQEMQTSFRSMRLAIGLAIFMVYLVMASQFESLVQPLIILFAVPFAAIGALTTMWLFGVTLNVVSLIGFVLLSGIVVNDAIVKIDYTNQLRRSGLGRSEAVVKAGLVRMRPILMTTMTTVLGLLPMAIGFGEGAELRTPMAITVIGGMVTATLLTLFVVPAAYVIFSKDGPQTGPQA